MNSSISLELRTAIENLRTCARGFDVVSFKHGDVTSLKQHWPELKKAFYEVARELGDLDTANRERYVSDPEYIRDQREKETWLAHIDRIETNDGHVIERIKSRFPALEDERQRQLANEESVNTEYQIIQPSGDVLPDAFDGKGPRVWGYAVDCLMHLYDSTGYLRNLIESAGNVARPLVEERNKERDELG